ncbi:hypothetical protein G8770_09795 [Aestuariicella hydrocarbonica]|uniref:Uncharacterized protein n=1 Tax=Pseudomaricurvus hydrocarbonicus TaxID=1470433 RepID=A0A9E5JUH7_9GAMM|nr:hypothetical protein [Aestuariicella hydrocarbonica]NHO65833.1 hypothetical protein [Aestuariicella hydrocarbonica]
MFQHHKYCVIDVSGLLVAYEDREGRLNLYLIEGADAHKAFLMNYDGADPLAGIDQANEGRDKIQIADAGLEDYLVAKAVPLRHSIYTCLLDAKITGTVDVNDQVVQLWGITQAVLNGQGKTLTYAAGT